MDKIVANDFSDFCVQMHVRYFFQVDLVSHHWIDVKILFLIAYKDSQSACEKEILALRDLALKLQLSLHYYKVVSVHEIIKFEVIFDVTYTKKGAYIGDIINEQFLMN